MQKFILFLVTLTFLMFNIFICTAQEKKKKESDDFGLLKPLTLSDSIGLMTLPKLTLPGGFNGESLPELPPEVDNSSEIYWRPVYSQVGLECGQASGIGLGFTYAINRKRNVPGNIDENQYTPHFTWNFANGGQGYYGVSYFHSFEIAKTLGNPNIVTYGGMFSPSPYNKWMTGYDNYYQSMNNRVSEIYQIDVSTEEGIQTAKHWLHNHLDSSDIGGVANFYANSPGASYTLPAGTPEAGKFVVKSWSSANHAMTISGYHDDICWDYNGDGQYTNNMDINSDGIVNVRDWEIGGFRFANTYSGGPNWANQGFSYMTYKSCADPYGSGGIWNNALHVLYVKENCSPRLTAKITLKHSCRNQIRVRMGVSTNQTSETPDYIIGFPVFDFQGGCQYMQGGSDIEDNKTIEFGLDLTPLLNLVGSNVPARYFILVDEDDPSNWSTGQIIQYSIIDYTSGINEVACTESNVVLNNNSLTKLWIDHTVNYSDIFIDDEILPVAAIFEDYSHQFSASGGELPYFWDFDKNYTESNSLGPFPAITSVQLSPSNNDDGFSIQNLDFSFPYYGNEYNQVRINVDGHIMFEDIFTWPYDVYDFFNFTKNKYIAPFMADLQIYSAESDGIWYDGDANSASFRWKASVKDQSTTSELNFMVTLFSNGDIRFRYGSINNYSDLDWISGVSAGDNKYYQFTEVSNDLSIPANHICNLSASNNPEGFNIDQFGKIEGKPQVIFENYGFKVRATDENNITTSKEVFLSTTGSYLMIDSIMVSSGGDDILEYGESATLSVIIKCVGNEPVNVASMNISIGEGFVTIIDNSEILGNFIPGQIKTFTNAFSFDISNDIPNDYEVDFLAIIDDNSGIEWENHILLNAYAPEINIGTIVVNDGDNGILDPNEVCDIVVYLSNNGDAVAYNLQSILTTTDSYVNINTDTDFLPELSNFTFGANATFNISIAGDVLIGHSIEFSLEMQGDLGISISHNFQLIIGQSPILIIDLDPNHSSAPQIEASLNALGVNYDILTSIPTNLDIYSGLFVCLGIYSSNHVLQSAEGQQLSDFLNNGGNLYMEGGDTWAFDSQTTAHNMFNINGTADGTADMNVVSGQSGSFTEGMSFTYSGENNYMDHLEPVGSAFLILENESPLYGTAVAYDAGTYKTIGTSHEFGGLTDGISPSTKEELMYNYLDFFNLLPPPVYSLDLTVYLEGSFNGAELNTHLNSNNLLPLQQPFNVYPWYYDGFESVSVIPNSDIVDWVLVELRDTTSAEFASSNSATRQMAAFLLKDGSIVRRDGISRLQFSDIIEHQLFVVIWHRNHLGILSANPLNNVSDIYYYDYSSYGNRVFGGSLGHKEISPGIWGMISGDANCDGQINTLDLSTIWSMQAGQSTYDTGDFNMDGSIDNKDKDDILINNNGYSDQVPD